MLKLGTNHHNIESMLSHVSRGLDLIGSLQERTPYKIKLYPDLCQFQELAFVIEHRLSRLRKIFQ